MTRSGPSQSPTASFLSVTWAVLLATSRPLQQYSVPGMLRLMRTHPGTEAATFSALKLLPPGEIRAGTVMLLQPEQAGLFEAVLDAWDTTLASKPVRNAVKEVRQHWSTRNGN